MISAENAVVWHRDIQLHANLAFVADLQHKYYWKQRWVRTFDSDYRRLEKFGFRFRYRTGLSKKFDFGSEFFQKSIPVHP